jgi:hypothetical protein
LKREIVAGALRLGVYVVVAQDPLRWYGVSLAQTCDEVVQRSHLRGGRLVRPALAARIIFPAEVSDQTDAEVRVIAGGVCAERPFGTAALDAPVREDEVVIADVVNPSPVEKAEAALAVYLIYQPHINRRTVRRQRKGRMMDDYPRRVDAVSIRDGGHARDGQKG